MERAALSIFIIDDHALFRAGLKLILQSAFEPVHIVEAASVEALLQSTQATSAPDVILLDIRLQGLSGLEAIALLHRRWPEVPVVMLSSDASSQTMRFARERGAAGFISKAEDSAQVVQALSEALGASGRPPLVQEPTSPALLTTRQCEVLHFLDQGLSNKSIARRLDLSENTVRGHVQAIMSALQATSRAQAVYKARQAGLIA